MFDAKTPDGYVYIHRDGRALWNTRSRTAQQAAAKAMTMDVPSGGHVEPVFDEDAPVTPEQGA